MSTMTDSRNDATAAPATPEGMGRDAVGKVFRILTCVSRRGPVRAVEIARQTGLRESTVRRLSGSLDLVGALKQTRAGYVLGDAMGLFRDGGDQARWKAFRDVLTPYVAELHHATRLTTAVAVLDGLKVVRLVNLYPRDLTAAALDSPEHIPVSGTALGKMLLALNPSAPELLPSEEAARVRLEGIATHPEELITGMTGIAVPIRNALVGLAALGVSGAHQQLTSEVEALLRDTGREASEALSRYVRGRLA